MNDVKVNSDGLRHLLEVPSLARIGPERREGIAAVNTIRAKVEETKNLTYSRKPLVLGLLFLWHDHLNESHEISQDLETAEGSLLHGMMHRREPDYWNSKYWFRRAGTHSIHEAMTQPVREFLDQSNAPEVACAVLGSGKWDPLGFVDACQHASGGPHPVLERLQQIEFLTFFDYLTSS
jgi:hypothetical protein